jgi:putative transposase
VLGVTRQGYYAFLKRPPSARAVEEVRMRERLKQLHVESRQTYGSPRMRRALRAEGMRVSKRRIERALRALELRVKLRRRFRVTTQSNPSHAAAPNVLARDFKASRPNERWVTDITYLWTQEGWCYLAAILDLYSRAVVGWAMERTLSTRLPLRALDMAVRRRRPGPGLLHHSDRGSQYTAAEYRHVLAQLGVEVSMSRKGNCWDNAVAESFFATVKTELFYRQSWRTQEELRSALFEYVEVFYNRRRLHSSLDYKTPSQAETEFALTG